MFKPSVDPLFLQTLNPPKAQPTMLSSALLNNGDSSNGNGHHVYHIYHSNQPQAKSITNGQSSGTQFTLLQQALSNVENIFAFGPIKIVGPLTVPYYL